MYFQNLNLSRIDKKVQHCSTNSTFHYWECWVSLAWNVLSLAVVLQEHWVASEHTHLLLNHQRLFSISLQVSTGQQHKWVPRIKKKPHTFLTNLTHNLKLGRYSQHLKTWVVQTTDCSKLTLHEVHCMYFLVTVVIGFSRYWHKIISNIPG